MSKTIEIPYKPREQMQAYHETSLRWRCLVFHRRFGKTTGKINDFIRNATTDPKILADKRGLKYTEQMLSEWRSTPRLFGYFAPYYSQAKSIAWDILKYYSSFIPGIEINESELRIDYPGKGRIRLFGADNPQSFRGFKWWETAFDEYSQTDPSLFDEVIAPGCLDTLAPATFMGTIIGKNHLYKMHELHKDDPKWFCRYVKASESGVIAPEILEAERERYVAEGKEAKFLQEFELEPMAAIEGAYLTKQLMDARAEGRIGLVPHEDWLTVDTYWDLGWDDTLFIIFVQNFGMERRIIDCMYVHGGDYPSVVKVLNERPYRYGTHFIPHDGKVHAPETGVQRVTTLNNLLRDPVVTLPRPKSKEDKIDAARWAFPKLRIDAIKCEYLISCLENYVQDFDAETGTWKNEPKHNWASHGFDTVAYLSLNVRSGGADDPTIANASPDNSRPQSQRPRPGTLKR